MVSHTATTRDVKAPSKPTNAIKSITFQNSLAREREREGNRERERCITELAERAEAMVSEGRPYCGRQ